MPGVSFYLTPARLRRLEHRPANSEYSYSAVDKSPLSNYVMRHWWVWTASFAPKSLAPNAITLLGFAAVVANFLTVWVAVPDLVGPGGSWVYASCALGLFFYQTMDNIDGKQARRTGTSSPLGELFDHGLDTLNCSIGGLIQAAAMGLGQTPYALLCVLVPCWSMYVSTWEEYHTGTLYLGYVNGPVEGVLIAVGILLVSAFKGPGWWALPVSEALGNIPLVPESWQVLDLAMLSLIVAFLCAHLPLWYVYSYFLSGFGVSRPRSLASRNELTGSSHSLLNVYSTLSPPHPRRALTSPRPASRRNPSTTITEAFFQLVPMLGFSMLAAAWVLSPKSRVLKEGYLEEFALVVCAFNPLFLSFAVETLIEASLDSPAGFLFGHLSSKIILAQLTRGPFPYSWILLLPLLIPAVGINSPYLGLYVLLRCPPLAPALLPASFEPLYLHYTLFLALASYGVAAHKIISAFCDFLGIKCLTIPYPNKACEGYEALPNGTAAVRTPVQEEREPREEEELELEMDHLASSPHAPTSPTRPASASRVDRLLGGVGVKNPFAGLLSMPTEGRKRSNTSERERAIGMGQGRRVAKVAA
ncbi:SPOSA6832_04957, partial [Sporobolomyces salmonicolor]